jgi:hypothetical protein
MCQVNSLAVSYQVRSIFFCLDYSMSLNTTFFLALFRITANPLIYFYRILLKKHTPQTYFYSAQSY